MGSEPPERAPSAARDQSVRDAVRRSLARRLSSDPHLRTHKISSRKLNRMRRADQYGRVSHSFASFDRRQQGLGYWRGRLRRGNSGHRRHRAGRCCARACGDRVGAARVGKRKGEGECGTRSEMLHMTTVRAPDAIAYRRVRGISIQAASLRRSAVGAEHKPPRRCLREALRKPLVIGIPWGSCE